MAEKQGKAHMIASGGPSRRGDQGGDVDRYVAARIRERRIIMGMTQPQLAALIKITYQQLHKYEVGRNRISAGWLFQIAEALGVEVGYFYEGVASSAEFKPPPNLPQLAALARNVAHIPNARQREAVCEFVR